jgi:hypothetical protein
MLWQVALWLTAGFGASGSSVLLPTSAIAVALFGNGCISSSYSYQMNTCLTCLMHESSPWHVCCYTVTGIGTASKLVTFDVTLPNGQKLTPSCTTGTRRASVRETSPGTCSVIVSSPVPGNIVATAAAPGTNGPITSTSPGPDGRSTNGQSSIISVVPLGRAKLTITGGPLTAPVNGNATLTATYTGEVFYST